MEVGYAMANAIARELRAMTIETRALVRELGADPELSGSMDELPSDAHARLEALQARWRLRFENLARMWSKRLVTDVTASSTAQLVNGLKDVAELQQIESTMQTPRMRAVVEAAAQASVGMITRIPAKYLGEVQAQVMNAITTGSGLNKLVPYLTKRYHGDVRRAQLTALDQVRKVSESVSATRLQALGVEEYVWVAVGGERYPRELHHRHLNGRVFRYDKPPIIQRAEGNQPEVRGKPGDLIGCRCRARPVLNFTKVAA
jgi:SPP1 gp7 family putative phage head morphogenesis protein